MWMTCGGFSDVVVMMDRCWFGHVVVEVGRNAQQYERQQVTDQFSDVQLSIEVLVKLRLCC